MKLGISKVLSLTLEVLPPLQQGLGPRVAADAVQAACFEGSAQASALLRFACRPLVKLLCAVTSIVRNFVKLVLCQVRLA